MNQSKARDFGRGGGVRDITPILEMPEETEAGAWSDYLTSNRAAAVLVWLLAVVCTYELTRRLLAGALGLLLAGIVQFVLTRSEKPIWNRWAYDDLEGKWFKRRITGYAWFMLGVDAALNLAGAWFIVQRLHTFPPVLALAEMTGRSVGPITGGWAVAICTALSVALCAGPEILWADN